MANGDNITAQAADGSLHVFPAGTDVSVIDSAMKRYAAPRQTGAMQAKPSGPITNARNLTPAAAVPSTGGNAAREAGLGAASAILPESSMTTDWRQNLAAIARGLNEQVNRAATTPWGQGGPIYGTGEMLVRGIMNALHGTAGGVEEMAGSFGRPTTEHGVVESGKFAHGAGTSLGNLLTLGLASKTPEALGDPFGKEGLKGVGREVLGEGASKVNVLSDMHSHAIETQKHIAGVADAVHTDAQHAMAQVSQTIDAAKPQGVFDRGDVGSRLDAAIGDTLSDRSQLPKAIQKLLPKEIEGKQPGPSIGGKALDLSKPEDMAAYQRYKTSGAFTPEEIAKYEGKGTGMMSFEDLKQARSDLGTVLDRLGGPAKAASNAAYSELSKMLREGARANGVEPDWIDANARYKNYMDDFVRSPLKKTLESENASDIMEALTGKSRIQVQQILQKYEPFGLDLGKINQEIARSGMGETVLKLSRPNKMDLLLARLSPSAVALRQVGPRIMRNPRIMSAIAGEGFEPKSIPPEKVYPSQKVAAKAAKKP